MKQLLTLVMVILLSCSLATTALAKREFKDYGDKTKTYDAKDDNINAKHDKTLEKAAKIRDKRETSLENVNKLQKERQKKIKHDDPGNNQLDG